MDYLTLKALHIIFVVTWFAGLFYIVRLFVYQVEALNDKEEVQRVLNPQLALMARRLWLGITWPSAVITLILGVWIIVLRPVWLQMPFMHVKLSFVFLLFVYHFICHRIYRQLQKGVVRWSSDQLRIWNEVATLFLVAVVFLIVKQNAVDWLYGTLGLVIFAVALMVAIRIYKRLRTKKSNS
jgi:putative membrane protein